MTDSRLYAERLDLTRKYWEYLSTGSTYLETDAKIIDVYAHTIERDLHILQLSILSDLQFEVDHGIATSSNVVSKLKIAKQIAIDIFNFNALKNS